MSALLDLTSSIARTMALVFSFSSFVLAAISIRWVHTTYASFFKVDPATIVAGILGFLYFLSITVFGRIRSTYSHTKTVLAVSTLLCLYFLGVAISYSATRTHSYYNCANATNTPTGNIFRACAGLNKALQAITWSCFIFIATYIVTLYLLAKKHATHAWTNRENGMNVPVGLLNPAEPKTDYAPKH